MKRFNVYVSGWGESSRAVGAFLQLVDARKHALSYLSQTRNVQIFKEWEIKLPFGWMLFRTKKLTDWHTGATL